MTSTGPQTSIATASKVLRESFGFNEFLPFQKEIIERITAGEDLLAVLPTGSGKSLCFQIPALVRPGLTIVISPLIALMKDQLDSLRARGLPAVCLNSSLAAAECHRVLEDVRSGFVKLLYVSPERLRDGLFLNALISQPSALLWVVDEAHCITEWGHDFRTDYLFIPHAIDLVSRNAQLVMFTATATPIVRKDILRQMRRQQASVLCGNFDRPNLYLGCRHANTKDQKYQTLIQLLRRPGPGIIYTATRRQCEEVNRFLQELGKRSDYYHAGRTAEARAHVHERFLADEIEIVAATNAFGMGLDKPDIRFIIHYAHPASIDAYYQEIGRGGRNGERCDCILLFSRFDRKVQERFIFDSTPPVESIEECFHKLAAANMRGLISVNRELYEAHSVELFEMEKSGLLRRNAASCGNASIYLSKEFEKALSSCQHEESELLRALDLHLAFSKKGYVKTDLNNFARAHLPHLDAFTLEQALIRMDNRGLIAYRPAKRGVCYEIRAKSISDSTRRMIAESVMARRAFKMGRLDMMASYGLQDTCLRRYLLDALEDRYESPRCGFCDHCL
jgi:ATP-dependent DNA helicase RecQ